jgi:hypothetical protein
MKFVIKFLLQPQIFSAILEKEKKNSESPPHVGKSKYKHAHQHDEHTF